MLLTATHDDAGARGAGLALAAWSEHDRARCLHPADHDAVRTTEAARSLVLELFAGAHERDLFSACARLGALLAEAGASPSLAAGAIDGAARALTEAGASYDPARVGPARASLVEGYVAAVRDAERAQAKRSWEYPACAVPLASGAVAVACGHPTEDREALAAWAARVAGRLVKEGVGEVVLAGPDVARAEVASAVELVGIRLRAAGAARAAAATGGASATARSWLRLPWRR